jgi:hypothetical protein
MTEVTAIDAPRRVVHTAGLGEMPHDVPISERAARGETLGPEW